MKKNFKFALFSWRRDDEGGWGVCYFKDFNPGVGYNPDSGCWARPSKLICGFNTAEEAANSIYDPKDEYYSKEEIVEEIQELVDGFLYKIENPCEVMGW